MWRTSLPWRYMIPRDILLSVILTVGERLSERIFLPGLHRSATRIVVDDPIRSFVAEVLALLVLIWMFYLGLYTISLFTARPIRPYATALVGGGLMLITFIGSTAEWFALPVPPQP
jgi:hypothetical protein